MSDNYTSEELEFHQQWSSSAGHLAAFRAAEREALKRAEEAFGERDDRVAIAMRDLSNHFKLEAEALSAEVQGYINQAAKGFQMNPTPDPAQAVPPAVNPHLPRMCAHCGATFPLLSQHKSCCGDRIGRNPKWARWAAAIHPAPEPAPVAGGENPLLAPLERLLACFDREIRELTDDSFCAEDYEPARQARAAVAKAKGQTV